MKHIQKLAGLTFFLIAVFMVIALIRYQTDDEVSLLPERLQYDFDEEWHIGSLDAETGEEIVLPYIQKHHAAETIVFHNILSEDFSGMTMRFYTENAAVRIVLDGEEIYQKEDENSSLDTEHAVDIPKTFSNGELQIELTVLNQEKEMALGQVVLEAHDVVIFGLSGSNLVDIACCLLIMIAAVVMLVLALIRWHTEQPERGELFLGLFGLVAGVYCFIGTNTLRIFFYSTGGAYMVQDYIILMLPLLLAFYFERNLRTLYPRRFAVLLVGVILNAGIQIFLHCTGPMNM